MAFTPKLGKPVEATNSGFTPSAARQVAPAAASTTPLDGFATIDRRDWIDKAGDAVRNSPLGFTVPLGEAIGNSIGSLGAAAKFALEGKLSAAKAALQVTPDEPTPAQVVGSAAASALLPASLAIGGGATVAANAGRFGALAASSAGAESLARGNGPEQVAIDAFKGGLTGAALGAGTKIVGNAINAAAARTPEALYNNALKVTQKLKMAGRSPAEFLKDKGVWGSLGTFKKAAQEGIEAEEAAILPKVAKAAGGLTYQDVKAAALTNLSKTLGNLYSKPELEALVDRVPLAALRDAKGLAPWTAVNEVRSSLGKLVGDTRWLTTNPTENVQATQAVYRALASSLQKATGTVDEFARLSQWVRTAKVVDSTIAKADSKYGLGLYDILSGAGGAAIGGITSEGDIGKRLKDAAIGGAAGLALERTVNSPGLKTGLAQIISRVGTLPTDAAGKISRAAVLQLIASLEAASPEDQR